MTRHTCSTCSRSCGKHAFPTSDGRLLTCGRCFVGRVIRDDLTEEDKLFRKLQARYEAAA